jgi:hypothetical protein
MRGILRQIKRTQDDVSFEVLVVQTPKDKNSIEFVLLNIKGEGVRLAWTLFRSELIYDFSSSNILFSDDGSIYILPVSPGWNKKAKEMIRAIQNRDQGENTS